MNRIQILLLLFTLPFTGLFAQSTEEAPSRITPFLSGRDSIWSDSDKLPLSERDQFFITDPSQPELLHLLPDLPLSKDFSEYIYSDSTSRILNINQLPTYVIWRIGQGNEEVPESLKSFAIYEAQREELIRLYNSSFTPGASLTFTLKGDLQIPAPGAGGRFSAEDILRHIFWKSERAKKRNRKHANAWKFYNSMP